MSITPAPNVPAAPPAPSSQPATQVVATPRWIYVVVVILFAGCIYLGYAGYTARAQFQSDLAKSGERADQLSARLDQANGRIAELQGKLEVTSNKLGLTQAETARAHSLAQQIQQDQQKADQQLTAQIGQVAQESNTKIGAVSSDLSSTKNDLAGTKKDLADTQAKLTTTIGDLGVQSGLIAKNQEEVEQLKRLGDRNIFDFSLGKSKNFQRVGPIQVKLDKVDTKHYTYTMTLNADDKIIEKKDKTADEPVQFYVAKERYEIVVFQVGKDKVTGYLSIPKDVASTASPAPKAQP
jgi:predicted outer membrane protein